MDRLLEVLTGLAPLPPTRFVGHEGHIDDESWTRLLEALRCNKEAVGVRLRGCGISCTRASQLAEAMATNTALEVLELPDNRIGERGAQALVDTLRLSNCTLKSIDLSGNPCYEHAAHVIQELDTLLKRNRVIKKLPKTPTGGSRGLTLCSGGGLLASKSAHCTPAGNTLPTPQIAKALLATSGLTPSGLPFELEQRLQHLEEAEATIRSELEHVRSFSSQSEVWQKKIDAAGQQIAAILSLVDSRNLTLEARLQTMELWRTSAEQAWAGQSKVLEDMASQLVALMRRVQMLEAQPGRADTKISNGGGRTSSISTTAMMGVPPSVPPPGFSFDASFLAAAESESEPLNAAVLWQEMAVLRKRLTKLEEAKSPVATVARDAALAADQPAKEGLHDIVSAQHPQEQQESAARKKTMSMEGNTINQGELGLTSGNVASGNVDKPATKRGVQEAVSPAGGKPVGSDATGSGGPSSAASASRRAQLTFSASISELSSIDNMSPPSRTGEPGEELASGGGSTAAGVCVSPAAPLGGHRHGNSTSNSSGCSNKASSWHERKHQQQPRAARTTDTAQEGKGKGTNTLKVPNSPILWHVNTFAVSPGSCIMTPTHDRVSVPAAYGCEGVGKMQSLPTAAAPTSSLISQECSQDTTDEHVGDIAGDCPGGFVMYTVAPPRTRKGNVEMQAAAGVTAAQRYAPLHPSDPRDSVDLLTHTLRPVASVVGMAANSGSEDDTYGGRSGNGNGSSAGGSAGDADQDVQLPGAATTPTKTNVALLGSPGTPRGSTFSVDAETVSLSVAMAGSTARPRAPAAAATNTDTSPLAHAMSTKDPGDAKEAERQNGWSSTCRREKPLLPADVSPESGCVTALGGARGSISTATTLVAGSKEGPSPSMSEMLGYAAEAAPRSPRNEAVGVEVQVSDSIGTPGVSVRQWAASGVTVQSNSVAGAVTSSVGSLTPSSKACPPASSAPSVSSTRPGHHHQHLVSPPLGALSSLARRGTMTTRAASRSGADAQKSAAEGKTAAAAAAISPGWSEGHGGASRPPHSHHPQAASAAAVTGTSVCGRPRDSTSLEKGEGGCVDSAATTSATATTRAAAGGSVGRESVTMQQHTTEDIAGAIAAAAGVGTSGASKAASTTHVPSTRHVGGGSSGVVCATSVGGHSIYSGGPHAAATTAAGGGSGTSTGHMSGSWISSRTSMQSHSIRSLAARGEHGAGVSAKPGGTAAVNRGSKSGSGSLHRPSSSANNTTTAATAGAGGSSVSATASRSACFGAVSGSFPTVAAAGATMAYDHPLRSAGPTGHRTRRTEGGASGGDPGLMSSSIYAVALPPPPPPLPDHEDSFQGPVQDGHFKGHAGTVSIQQTAVELVGRTASHSDGGGAGVGAYGGTYWHDAHIGKELSVCSVDTGEGAAAVTHTPGLADGAAMASVAALHQPQHSSRGYRPAGTTSRTLAPGTAGNVAGPLAKGGPARTSTRTATSVAGATKRWM